MTVARSLVCSRTPVALDIFIQKSLPLVSRAAITLARRWRKGDGRKDGLALRDAFRTRWRRLSIEQGDESSLYFPSPRTKLQEDVGNDECRTG